MDELLNNLGYDIQGNPTFQAGEQAIQQNLQPFDPAQAASVFEENIGQPARRSFQEETAPAIAQRFTNLGASRSSARDLALSTAGERLETSLAGQKSSALMSAEQQKEQIRNQAIQQALGFAAAPGQQGLSSLDRYLGLLNQGFSKQFDVGVKQGSPGMGPALIGAAGTAIGGALGGPLGASLGGMLAGKAGGFDV